MQTLGTVTVACLRVKYREYRWYLELRENQGYNCSANYFNVRNRLFSLFYQEIQLIYVAEQYEHPVQFCSQVKKACVRDNLVEKVPQKYFNVSTTEDGNMRWLLEENEQCKINVGMTKKRTTSLSLSRTVGGQMRVTDAGKSTIRFQAPKTQENHRLTNLFHASIQFSVTNILSDGGGKQWRFLADHSYVFAQVTQVDVFQIYSIHCDLTHKPS